MAAESVAYDELAHLYNKHVKSQPHAIAEAHTLQQTLQPLLAQRARGDGPGPRLLDLACGSGYYARRFLAWGAGEVVGVDISRAMVDEARRGVATGAGADDLWRQGKKVAFRVGDACTLGPVDGRPGSFDVVTGVWLLNYATSRGALAGMFRTVAANLRPGGTFVAVTVSIAAQDDADAWVSKQRDFEQRHPGLTGVGITYAGPLADAEDGYRMDVRIFDVSASDTSVGKEPIMGFEVAGIRKKWYEQAIRDAGLKESSVAWKPVEVPDAARMARGDEYWKLFEESGTHITFLTVEN